MSGPTPRLADIRALEEELPRPEIRRSRAALDALLADGFVEIGASGRVYRREETIELLVAAGADEQGALAADGYALTPLAPDVVLLTYVTRRASVDGRARHVLRSSIWVRTGATWRLRFHQGTIAAASA